MTVRSGKSILGDQLQNVSYSPDDSQVAVVTVGHDADGSYRSFAYLEHFNRRNVARAATP
jgi:hypothetical protein